MTNERGVMRGDKLSAYFLVVCGTALPTVISRNICMQGRSIKGLGEWIPEWRCGSKRDQAGHVTKKGRVG